MSPQSLHVRIHRDRSGYWAQVKEWPGCFAAGGSWEELTEAIEEAVGMCMASEDEAGPTPVALRIREIELEVDSDMPLIRALAEESVAPLPSPPRTRDPHPDWPLREFGQPDRSRPAMPDEYHSDSDEHHWEGVRANAPVDERHVAAHERLMAAEQRLYDHWEKRGEVLNWAGARLRRPIETDTALWVMELGEKIAVLGGQLELAAVFRDERVTLLIEPGTPPTPAKSG